MGLNDQYNLSIQFDLKEFEGGSYADLTYQVIQRMIKAGPSTLRPLYKSLVSVISNTAPYVKSLSKDSSEGIFALMKTFSDADLLRKREETSRILSNLFEAVNYILLYHDEGNEEFLVALIKFREILKISDLKLALALPEVPKQAAPTPAVKHEDSKVEEVEAKSEDKKIEKQTEKTVEKQTEKTVEGDQEQADKVAEPTSEESVKPAEPESEKPESEIPVEGVQKPESETPVEEAKKPDVATTEVSDTKATEESTDPTESEQSKVTEESTKTEESKNSDDNAGENDEGNMVNVPLDNIKHDINEDKSDASKEKEKKAPSLAHQFMTPEWEAQWKEGLNLPNIKQAIQYTDDKARSFLAKNPSPDNNIDADKFVEFLKKSSLKGLLPNQVKILVTTYNGNSSIDTWAISYIWGQVFMRQQDVPMFNIETIKMFKVNFVQPE